MGIDQSIIYAKRFETDPTPLKQAVLGNSPQGLQIDPYTALRALQHIDQAKQMQTARMAQQAPAANAQPSIADAALEEAFGTGGIVAFAMGGTPVQHYRRGQLTQAEQAEADYQSGASTEGQGVSDDYSEDDDQQEGVGNTAGLKNLYSSVSNANAPAILTGPEREAAVQAMYKKRQDQFGPDIYAPAIDRIDKGDAEGLKAKDQGLGLSLLKAAAAMSQGNNLGRAAANAAGAFGESYGEALKEHRAEQEHRDAMRFHMADAQRKDRMGQYALAADSIHKSALEGIDAHKAEMAKYNALANIQKAINTSNKPGTQINPTNLLYNAQTTYDENPTKENLSKLNAAKNAVAATKTTFGTVMTGYVGGEQPKGDIEGGKANTLSKAQEETAVANAEKEYKDETSILGLKRKHPEVFDLQRKDPAAYQTGLANIKRDIYKRHGVGHRLSGSGGGGNIPALPSGYRED